MFTALIYRYIYALHMSQKSRKLHPTIDSSMNNKIKASALQIVLETACKGTSVTPRDLVKELSIDDLADIKNGDMTATDLVNLVTELADNIDNAKIYRVKVKNTETKNTFDGIY